MVAAAFGSDSDGDGVVATFFLIRYHSVIASRTEINFARQFFRMRVFFISLVQQYLRYPLAELLRGETALDASTVTN